MRTHQLVDLAISYGVVALIWAVAAAAWICVGAMLAAIVSRHLK